jgi:hypothetical protein
VLSNLLREARERVESALNPPNPATPPAQADTETQQGEVTHIPIKIERSTPVPSTPEQPAQKIPINVSNDKSVDKSNDKSIDDDLARRRSRLSNPATKPADPDKPSP